MPTTTPPPTRICVFCAASPGTSPAHIAMARSLAHTLHKHSIQLIYGGGTTGLMGELASTLVALSGQDSVIGVMAESVLGKERPKGMGEVKVPRHWVERLRGSKRSSSKDKKEKQGSSNDGPKDHQKYGHLTITSSLSARKNKLIALTQSGGPGSGFIALSGGFGTADELMEVVSGYQRGIHSRRVVMLNGTEGYWDGVVEWIDRAVGEGFVKFKDGGGKGQGEERFVVAMGDAEGAVGFLRGAG